MSQNLEEWLLTAENKAAAEASRFPPAEVMEKLELRRAALREKKQLDDDRREIHRKLLALLDGPQGDWMRAKAHEQIDKWESRNLCHPRYIVGWRSILAMAPAYRDAAVLREDDIGVSMRQNSPFDHSYCLIEK